MDGEDYSGRPNDVSSILTFPADANNVLVNISILENNIREGDETFVIAIDSVACGGSLGNADATYVTIYDNDGMLFKCYVIKHSLYMDQNIYQCMVPIFIEVDLCK